MGEIKATIYCLTYNHKEYIRDAMNGFLMQKTDFNFDIFIFDDASTDGTSDIVREYQEKYPDKVRAFVSPVNTFGKPERFVILQKLYKQYIDGKYVAWCEADDVWTDSKKLQIQVEFLENNPECVMTTHSFDILDCTDDSVYTKTFGEGSRYLSNEEIVLQPNGNLATASLVMRRDVFVMEGFPQCNITDYPMQLCAISKGRIYYMGRNMCMYRYMHAGSWCSDVYADEYKRMLHNWEMVSFLDRYDGYTENRFHKLLYQRKVNYLNDNIFAGQEHFTIQEYKEMCEMASEKNSEGKKYVEAQINIFSYLKGELKYSQDEIKRINKFKHRVIMGHGKFAGYVKREFELNKLEYDGYVVTKLNNDDKDNKDIWELGSYPYEKRDTLVVIGISQINSENNIILSLVNNDFRNIMTPLWIKID